LFAVDAPPKVRYERIKERKSETDQVSYEQFIQNEDREMHATDPNKQNISKVVEEADFVFQNDGTIEELHEEVEKVLDQLAVGSRQ
jgi:dephospho-CoA kinase